MHPEAYDAVGRMVAASGIDPAGEWTGLDIGGRDVNGSARAHLPNARWHGLDAVPGPGVDIVADARDWNPDAVYDVVLCTELLEHVRGWRHVLIAAAEALDRHGFLFLTAASHGRRPHSADGHMFVPAGEHYANVDPEELRRELAALFAVVFVDYQRRPGDVYAWATAPRRFA